MPVCADDEVGLRLQHDFDVRSVAAAGEAAKLGKPCVAFGQKLRLVRPQRSRPPDQLVGGDREARQRAYAYPTLGRSMATDLMSA